MRCGPASDQNSAREPTQRPEGASPRSQARRVASPGASFVEERCHGEGLAEQLGEFELDPTAELAAACSGEPYVCEVNFVEWDETRCRPWPEQQAIEDGCGCHSDVSVLVRAPTRCL